MCFEVGGVVQDLTVSITRYARYLALVASARHVGVKLRCLHLLGEAGVISHGVALKASMSIGCARVSVDVAIAPHVPRLLWLER